MYVQELNCDCNINTGSRCTDLPRDRACGHGHERGRSHDDMLSTIFISRAAWDVHVGSMQHGVQEQENVMHAIIIIMFYIFLAGSQCSKDIWPFGSSGRCGHMHTTGTDQQHQQLQPSICQLRARHQAVQAVQQFSEHLKSYPACE